MKISIHGSSIDQVLTSILTKKRPCIGQYVVCVLTNTLADTRLTHGLICGLCLLDKCKSICRCRSCKVFIRVEGDDFCTGFLKFHCQCHQQSYSRLLVFAWGLLYFFSLTVHVLYDQMFATNEDTFKLLFHQNSLTRRLIGVD